MLGKYRRMKQSSDETIHFKCAREKGSLIFIAIKSNCFEETA